MDERARRWERRFEIPVLVAAVLVIPVIAIEQSSLGEPWRTVAAVLNWAIWIVFALELVTMLAVVPNGVRWGSQDGALERRDRARHRLGRTLHAGGPGAPGLRQP